MIYPKLQLFNDLLAKYGNSRKDVEEIVRQMQAGEDPDAPPALDLAADGGSAIPEYAPADFIEALLKRQSQPYLGTGQSYRLSTDQLRQLGYEVGDGWEMVMRPDEVGATWLHEMVSPEGQATSAAGLVNRRQLAQAQMQSGAQVAEAPQVAPQDIEGLLGRLYTEDFASGDTLAGIQAVEARAEADPEAFVADIVKRGRNADTEAVLRVLGATNDELDQLFGGPQVAAAIPPEGMTTTLDLGGDKPLDVTIGPDYVVRYEDRAIGAVSKTTGEFTARPDLAQVAIDLGIVDRPEDLDLSTDYLARAWGKLAGNQKWNADYKRAEAALTDMMDRIDQENPKLSREERGKLYEATPEYQQYQDIKGRGGPAATTPALGKFWELGKAALGVTGAAIQKYAGRPFETAVLMARTQFQIDIGKGTEADFAYQKKIQDAQGKYGWAGVFVSQDAGDTWYQYLKDTGGPIAGLLGTVDVIANPLNLIPVGGTFELASKYVSKIPVLGRMARFTAAGVTVLEQGAAELTGLPTVIRIGSKVGGKAAEAVGMKLGEGAAKLAVSRSKNLLLEIPATDDILKGVLVDNWQRRALQAMARVPVLKSGIEKGLGYRILVDTQGKAVESIVGRGAVAWNEINRMGVNAAGAKVAELKALEANPVKLFGFSKNAVSDAMKAALKPQFASDRGIAGTVEHVFTHPDMYNLTPKQAAYVARVNEVNDLVTNMLRNEGVAPQHVIDDWMHRVLDDIERRPAKGQPRTAIGAKPGYERQRQFKTMAEGIQYFIEHPELGKQYSANPEVAVGEYIRQAFKKMADNRLEKYVEEFGVSPLERLRERFPGLAEATELTKAQLGEAARLRGAVTRALRGERLPNSTIRSIEKAFPEQGKRLRRALGEPTRTEAQLRAYLEASQRATKEATDRLSVAQGKITEAEVRAQAAQAEAAAALATAPAQARPVELPPDDKLLEAFKVMDYEDRSAFRDAMNSRRVEVSQVSEQFAAEIEGLQETLNADRLYNFRIQTGTKVVGKGEKARVAPRTRSLLQYYWNKEAGFPEYFTVKQAEEILGKPVKSASSRAANRVPRGDVLDAGWVRELGFDSAEDVVKHLDELRAMKQQLDDLKGLRDAMASRDADLQKMLGLVDSVDASPEQLAAEIQTTTPQQPNIGEHPAVYTAGGPGGPQLVGGRMDLWAEPNWEPIPIKRRGEILDSVYKAVTEELNQERLGIRGVKESIVVPASVRGRPVDLVEASQIRRTADGIEYYLDKRWRKLDEQTLERWAAMWQLTPLPPSLQRPGAYRAVGGQPRESPFAAAWREGGRITDEARAALHARGFTDDSYIDFMPDSEIQKELSRTVAEATGQARGEPLPMPVEGTPEAGLQIDMFGFTHRYVPKGKGKVTQLSLEDYQKLVEYSEKQRQLPGVAETKHGPWYRARRPPDFTVKPKVEGVPELSGETSFAHFRAEVPEVRSREDQLRALGGEAEVMLTTRKAAYTQAKAAKIVAMEKVRQPGIGEGYIMQPFASGKIYSQEFIDRFNKFFGHDPGSKALNVTADINGILRLTKASLDFSAMMVQGLPSLGLGLTYMAFDRKIGMKLMGNWFKAFGIQVGAFISPDVFYRYMERNSDLVSRRLSFGGSSRAVDYFDALHTSGGLGGLADKALDKIPLKPFERAEIAFYAGSEYVRNTFWEILSPKAIKAGKEFELARHLDLLTGIADSRAAGVPMTVRQLEQTFGWFAPNYTRACLTIVADIFRGGYTGAMAKKALGGLIAGGAAMYAATQYATASLEGKSAEQAWDTVKAGFGSQEDPITGEVTWKPTANFMTLRVGNYNIGPGGFWYGLVRLAGNISETVTDEDQRINLVSILKNGGPNQDNPFIYWWYTRSAPLVGTGFDLASGRDFLGYLIETPAGYAKYVATRFEPMWMEQGINWMVPTLVRDGEVPEGVAKAVLPVGQLFGLRAFPNSAWGKFYDQAAAYIPHLPEDQLDPKQRQAWRDGKLGWSQLSDRQKADLLARYDDLNALYVSAEADSAVRDSSVWRAWTARMDEERQGYYGLLDDLAERLKRGEMTTKEYRERGAEAGQNYGAAMDAVARDPAYKDIYAYFDKKNEVGGKYQYQDDIALGEYQATVLYADDLEDANGDYNWDERDRRVAAFKEKWGQDTYDWIQEYLKTQKEEKGVNAVWVRKSQDSEALRDYWQIDADAPDATEKRVAYRLANPEADARLGLWGYGGKLQSEVAYDLVEKWARELGVPFDFATLGMPPRELAPSYFEYGKIVNATSGGSAEARLYRLDNPEWDAWGQENYGWKPLDDDPEKLRTAVEWPKQWGTLDAQYRKLPESGYEREWFLQEHTDFLKAATDYYGWQAKDFSKVPTKVVAGLYDQYNALRTAEGKADATARLAFRRAHPELEQWGEIALAWKPVK